MALADIQEKQSEERKREKLLVHFANSVTRDFLESKHCPSKTKTNKDNADYVAKSFLDYLFFNQHKEIREITKTHIEHFMLDYAPRKLNLAPTAAKDITEILSKFLIFLSIICSEITTFYSFILSAVNRIF